MINDKLKYIAIALIICASNGCKEEFLDFKPVAASNSVGFYQSQQDAEQAVTAAYSTFNYISAWDMDNIEAMDIASDDAEAGGAYVNEVPGMESFNRLTIMPTTGGNAYGAMFKGIAFSNIAIEKLPPIKAIDPKCDPVIIDRMVAECKFIRAICYFSLAKHYGGVPLITKIPTSSEYFLAKSPLIDIYTQVEKDLKEAIEVLPEKTAYSANDIGRASKGAAKALLSKALLFQSSYAKNYPGDSRFAGMTERWADALDYAEQVINSNVYSLPGYNGETYNTWRSATTNGYRYEFTTDADNGPESIFEIQCIPDGLEYVFARGSAFANFTCARNVLNNGASQASGYWGLDLPTYHLINEFEKDANGNTDPRLRSGIAIEGNNDSIQVGGGLWKQISYAESVTKTYLTKYEVSAAEYKDIAKDWDCSPLNVRLIRLAEVYLIASEAAIMLNQNDKALQYINMVRTRARNCGPAGNTVPADYAAGTPITLDMLIHERRVELYCEGNRYFDLVRWRKALQTLNGTTTFDGYPISYESPKNDFFPIPQREIEISNGLLKQNEGW